MLIEKDQLVSDEPKPAWTTGLTLSGTHNDSNSSMTKISSINFNHDDKKMKWNNEAILEIFYVK